MSKVKLCNDQWRKMKRYLAENPEVCVGKPKDCRRFIEGVLWLTRSGSRRRLLPERYGKWSVYKRFDRWSERGIWQEMFEHFADDPDVESVMIDSSVIRARACAAGAPAKKGNKRAKRSATAEAGSAASYTPPS